MEEMLALLGVAPYATALAVSLFIYFVVYPWIMYVKDAKGLRRFPNMSTFSGMSDLPFMALAHTGARSAHLAKLHKDEPVLRTGPNSLSFGRVAAIKDIYSDRIRHPLRASPLARTIKHGTPLIRSESRGGTSGANSNTGKSYHIQKALNHIKHPIPERGETDFSTIRGTGFYPSPRPPPWGDGH